MIFRYSDEENEIALTSKGFNYRGINEPYSNLMQLYVYSLLFYYLLVNTFYTLL